MAIGTGKMSFKLYSQGYNITGVDSSIEMINQAVKIMPKNKYMNKDFISSLEELKEEKFDLIIFAYSIHHISTKEQVNLLLELSKNLNHNGEIIIADVMTKTNNQMLYLSESNKGIWDDEEYYPTLENYSRRDIISQFKLDFEKVSFCSGVLTLKVINTQ